MRGSASILTQKSLVIVFTYAPAGLGHLRVTDALYAGLPEGSAPLLLGSRATAIKVIHRIVSVHYLFRRLFEWGQSGSFQHLFTTVYKSLIKSQKNELYDQINTLLDQRIELPEKVLIVGTHFGLAHQAAALKKRIERERKVQVFLAVQVTDDSPQYIWYVPEADLTIVPSEYTKEQMLAYGKRVGHKPIPIEVTAYPVSPLLTERLTPQQFHEREHQLDPESRSQVHVSIPISGAAVQLQYFTKLVDALYRSSHRYIFHVVTRSAPYTLPFLKDMIERPYVKLYVSPHDREVVDMYEEVFQKHKISLEVTKPSEQAFKALVSTRQRGGTILLFSEPVGRQEYDNIDFLRRHGLIPNLTEQRYLWEAAPERRQLRDTQAGRDIWEKALNWRGVELPKQAAESACFIRWCLEQGVFTRMMHSHAQSVKGDGYAGEVNAQGVQDFWSTVAGYLNEGERLC
ncbi:MAG: hypothetical protein ACOCXQ_03910 [Patescibacteria group bacterium]